MGTLTSIAVAFVAGGALFWLPSIALHLWRGQSFSGTDAIALTVILPVVGLAIGTAARRLARPKIRWLGLVPVTVCCGIWVLGPTAMFVSATPTGGGFATPNPWQTLATLTAMFPLTTFSMSTYDGSLGGLLIASLGFLILACWPSRARPKEFGA